MAHLTATDRDAAAESLTPSVITPASGSRIPPLEWDGTPLPEEVEAHPLLNEEAWTALRDSGRRPLDESPLVTTYQSRAEFLVGAWILDKLVPPRLGGSLLGNLQPQMLRTADILAAERFENGILEPRRSSKTTSLWCVQLGRAWMRPVYMVGYTMLTTAKKAGERFKLDVRDPIQRKWRDKTRRPLKLMESNGSLGIEFPNGSKLAILSPNGDDVRSGAYDLLVMDEGGEAEPEMWDDIVGAVVPSFDTRGPGAQLVYAGTGGKYRDGSHFWSVLHNAEAGRIRYGVEDDVDEATLQSWEAVRPIVERMHPGLDGLTTIEAIARNFPILNKTHPLRFAMEYLGYFGRDSGNASLLAASDWDDTMRRGAVPTGVAPLALAFAVHLGGAWASVAVGWHEADDAPTDLVQSALLAAGEADTPRLAAFKLVHHQSGNANLARRLFHIWRDVRLPIVHDDAPQERAVVQELQRLARLAGERIEFDMVRYAEKAVATTKLLNGITHGAVVHWEQPPLDEAARVAVPRISGKARLIGAADAEADITPLDAAALVLLKLPDDDPIEDFGPIVVH